MNKELIENIGILVGAGFTVSYMVANFFTGYLNEKSNRNVNNVSSLNELEEIILKEKVNFNIPKNIKIIKGERPEGSPSGIRMKEKNVYEIYINPSEANRISVRHELFHLKDGHVGRTFSRNESLNDLFSNLYYTFYAEPKTVLYCWKTLKKELMK